MDVAVFVVDEAADFGLAALLEVLGTADSLRDQVPNPPPPWTVRTIGTSTPVRSGAGHLVPATALAELTTLPDLLVVPATNVKQEAGLLATVTAARNAPALGLIAQAAAEGVPLAAACTGTFFLAEAGALDGHTATTSWWLGPTFRRRYPRVRLDERQTLCRSGRVTTAGAAFAHIDLALSIVQGVSPALAELVARYLLIGNRKAQADFAIPAVLAQADPMIAEFERWVRARLGEQLSISDGARALGLSERQLQRATAATLGISPLEFVTEIRLEQATHLLRTTRLGVDAIAARVGYLSGNTLREVVRRRRKMSLRELRDGPTPIIHPGPPGPDPDDARPPGSAEVLPDAVRNDRPAGGESRGHHRSPQA